MHRIETMANPAGHREDLLGLYDSVGWGRYTEDPQALLAALEGSAHVVAAWEGEQLAGLARVISDGQVICYVQDLLIHPAHQRRGLGMQLLKSVLEPFAHVRQKVLLADDDPALAAFYQAAGFHRAGQSPAGATECFVLID